MSEMESGYYWYRPAGDSKWYPIEVEGSDVTWFGSEFPGTIANLKGELIPLPTPDEASGA